MAEKPKKKSSKAKKDEKGVLAALPTQRPERIGGRRASTDARPEPGMTAATEAKPAAKASTSSETTRAAKASRATAEAKPAKAAAKPNGAALKAAKPRAKAKAARRKAAAPRTFEPTSAAEAAAGDADERAAGVKLKPARASRPRAVREGAPGIGGGPEPEERPAASGRPSRTELVTTAVKATGELAQIGISVGGRLLKRAVDRLPKR
jgi:hypothetical protein